MKKIFFLNVGIVWGYCILASSFAQTVDSTSILEYETGFWAPTYKHYGQEIDSDEFKDILFSLNDTEISSLYRGSKTFNTLANITGFVGGFCLGYGVFSKESQTGLIIAGAGIVVLGAVLNIVGNNKMKEAVLKYNEMYKQNINTGLSGGNSKLFQLGISFALR
jgi:hypothetical protein